MDHKLKKRRLVLPAQQAQLRRLRHTAIDLDGLAERFLAALPIAADPDEILLFDLLFRVHDPVGKFAVVRHQKKSLGVQVEPSDGIDPPAAVLNQLRNVFPALLVGKRRHIAARLVEHQVQPLRFLLEPDAVHLDHVLRIPERGRISVDAHAALRDQLLRLTAGGDSVARQDLL